MITNIETLNEEKPDKLDEINAVTTMASDIYDKDNTEAGTRSISRLGSMPELPTTIYSGLPPHVRGSIQRV